MESRQFFFAAVTVCVLVGEMLTPSATRRDSAGAGEAAREQSERHDAILRVLVAGLKAREASATTAQVHFVKECYYTTDSSTIDAFDDAGQRALFRQPPSLFHFFWAADGTKARQEEKRILPESSPHHKMVTYDGQRILRWDVGAPTATQYPGEQEGVPYSAGAFWLQLSIGVPRRPAFWPLSEAVQGRKASVVAEERIGDVRTYRVDGAGERADMSESWWIAPDLGCLVVRNERRKARPDPRAAITSWRHVVMVERIVKAGDGLWVPSVVRDVAYVSLREGRETWSRMQRYSSLSLEINRPVPATLFDIRLPLGTKIINPGETGFRVVGGDISGFRARVEKGTPEAHELLDSPSGKKLQVEK